MNIYKKEKIFGKIIIGFIIVAAIILFIFGEELLPIFLILGGILISFYMQTKNDLLEEIKKITEQVDPLLEKPQRKPQE